MTTEPIQQATPKDKLPVFILSSTIVGVILACVFTWLSANGWLQRWEIVGRVPEDTEAVINGSPLQGYIRNREKKILSCDFDNQDECWIPNVDRDPRRVKACDMEQVAFSAALHPPANFVSCIQVTYGYGETRDNFVYLIDPDHNLWRWVLSNTGGEVPILFMMLAAGGLGGALLGSVIWILVRILRRKKLFGGPPKFSIPFLVVPWICLLSFLAFRSFLGFLYHLPPSAEVKAIQTSTKSAQQTMEAEPFLVQITPGVGRVKYSFSNHVCDADWSAAGEIPCVPGSTAPDTAIRLQSISVIQSQRIDGQAILLPARLSNYLDGEFPAIEIQEGDHFRATIACLEEKPDCNLLFAVYLRRKDLPGIHLGTWKPAGQNRMEEMNIDLSKFAGQLVRFSLNVYSDDYKSNGNQDALWIEPKIERK